MTNLIAETDSWAIDYMIKRHQSDSWIANDKKDYIGEFQENVKWVLALKVYDVFMGLYFHS